jgi:DNA-binding MarR family transcriptional regulator
VTLVEKPTTTDADREVLNEVRVAMGELFGAERRLRAREQQEERDLTQSQFRALFILQRAEEVTAGELAKSADLNPASVTAMLDHLASKGIIERRRSTSDRRVCMVSLSPTGRALVEEKRAGWQVLWEEKFGAFSDGELGGALQVIRTMIEVLDTL